jgi:hypothetical protein
MEVVSMQQQEQIIYTLVYDFLPSVNAVSLSVWGFLGETFSAVCSEDRVKVFSDVPKCRNVSCSGPLRGIVMVAL